MFGRKRYVGRRRLADQDMHFEVRVTPDVSAYAAVIDDELERVLGPSMAAAARRAPKSAEVLDEERSVPEYGLFQIQSRINDTFARLADIQRTPPIFVRPEPPEWRPSIDWDAIKLVPPYVAPRPVSWRETIENWSEAYRSFARRVVTGLGQDPADIELKPDPGTAEWWEWHHGSVIFDEHLGMLELPPGKGLAGKGAT